ncbi:hypothetical protein BU25DRAFT_416284 [Macroventuria anomochaeta]|uniref:Uncharacterized protein n=1 Tax=Macroventuria anomochaeta TaxID=301207 RepID=A0ACB6RJX2_9PLEO|nr:uncharacterized protein BU25DRAFT_416284 [Macroventuria anomochaeta]KAF2621264.1 hypothetical protein BU25DRAFT_416284 [Macroventuria anomochaeta]
MNSRSVLLLRGSRCRHMQGKHVLVVFVHNPTNLDHGQSRVFEPLDTAPGAGPLQSADCGVADLLYLSRRSA